MSPDLIDPAILFAEPDHGSCCDCCEGYCPLWDDPHTDGFDRLVYDWADTWRVWVVTR